MCDKKKVKYTSENFALMDMKRFRKENKRSYSPIRSYYCYDCSAWHLTSAPDNREIELIKLRKKQSLQGQEISELKIKTTALKVELTDLKKTMKQYKRLKNENELLKSVNLKIIDIAEKNIKKQAL